MPTKKFKTKHAPGLIAQWGPRRDLNPHPDDYKSSALPFALRGHKWRRRVSYRCGAGDFLFLHNYYKNIMCYCIFQGLDLFAPIFILFQFLFLIDSFCTQFLGSCSLGLLPGGYLPFAARWNLSRPGGDAGASSRPFFAGILMANRFISLSSPPFPFSFPLRSVLFSPGRMPLSHAAGPFFLPAPGNEPGCAVSLIVVGHFSGSKILFPRRCPQPPA